MTSLPPLASLDDLTAYLGVPPLNEAQSTFMLRSASALVRLHCRWPITKVEDSTTWVVDSNGTELLTVPTLALRSVTAVSVRGKPVDLSEVSYSASGVLCLRRYLWPVGPDAVTVTGVSGHDEPPDELVAVVCSLASRSTAMAGRGPVTAYRVGGIQVTYGRNGDGEVIGLSPIESAVLDRYRLPLLT
ncbi:hypothetical protein ACWEVP_31725 [Amycolatopsis sp. NPDC003865]